MNFDTECIEAGRENEIPPLRLPRGFVLTGPPMFVWCVMRGV